MAVRIQRAGVEDLDRIAPMFDAYRQFYGQPPDAQLARAFLKERLERGQSVIFLAGEENKEPLGFAQLYPSFSSASARRIYILNDLFVKPAARRRGAGRMLLEAAAEFGRSEGAARLTLSTALNNAPAQALYEGSGWRRDSAFCTYNLPISPRRT